MKLQCKVEELEKKNKQLSKDILNYATIKEKYEQTLAYTSGKAESSSSISSGSSRKIGELKEKDIGLNF